MPRRATVFALAGLAALSVPATAAGAKTVKLGSGDVVALTGAGTQAAALVDAGALDGPVTAVRSNGRGARRIGVFADASAEFHAVAGDAAGRLVLAWDRDISGAVQYVMQAVGGPGPEAVAVGTGPLRLALLGDGTAVLAHPDEAGDIAVTTLPDMARPRRGEPDPYALPGTVALTSSGPRLRHHAAGLALRGDRPLVLDLVQARRSSELRVVGEGAPPGAVTAVKRLAELQGAIAADGRRIAVAYVSNGRPVLATAAPGGDWRRRRLPGRRVEGAPAVALSGSRAVVAWSQGGDVRAATVKRKVAVRRVTRSRAHDGPPLLAAAPRGGRVYAAWTRERSGRRTGRLRRLR